MSGFSKILFATAFGISIANAAPPKISIPQVDFKPAQVERVVLKNGIVVYLAEDHELPTFDINIRMPTSPADEQKPDSFSFLGALWRAGGTTTRTPDQLNDELEQLAISVETSADAESVAASLGCLSKDRPKGLEIFKDVLLRPGFDVDQFTLLRAKALESLRRKNETPNQIARRAFRDVAYGTDHHYAYEATEESLHRVTIDDLKKLHATVVVPDKAIIAVSGDFNRAELLVDLEKLFADWKSTGRKVPPYDYSVKNAREGTLFFVQKESNQSRITIGHVAVARHNPDHFALELADYIFGGGGPSRLFGEIRSRRGLAYVVGSFVQEPAGPGLLGVGCQTKSESSVAATQAILDELEKFSRGPISNEELRMAKDSTANSFVFGFDSVKELVDARATNEFYGFATDYLDTYIKRVQDVTEAQVGDVAKRYYAKGLMKMMLVGDEKNFDRPLDMLGAPVRIPLSEIR